MFVRAITAFLLAAVVAGCQSFVTVDVLVQNAGPNASDQDYDNWLRYRNQEGAWVQSASAESPYVDFVDVERDCEEYMRRYHAAHGEYRLVNCAHHARLWVLTYAPVQRPGAIMLGGIRDLWYDSLKRRVVAETVTE